MYRSRFIFFCTYSICLAQSLEVYAVALQGRKRGVPVAIVGLVVAHRERLRDGQVDGLQLGCKVVRGVQTGSVLVADGDREAFNDVRSSPGFLQLLLLDNQLVDTKRAGGERKVRLEPCEP